ncbi:MAG: Fe-S-containing hydro-lyase [Defluviitaleaceae bacterium]|nr:Fe-S-containing hydro-lyase [Defluviitaleaceae bacterium]
MTEFKKIVTPLTDEVIKNLQAGEMVHISGTVYTGRDAAHKRMYEMIKDGEKPPFDFDGNIIFYAGPSPTQPGHVIGSVGPTTAGRMDLFSPYLVSCGLKAMIGKGLRGEKTKEAIVQHNGVYFAAIGGIAALMSRCIKSVEIVAFEDLGTEAIRRLEVADFPVIVAIDSTGTDVYEIR